MKTRKEIGAVVSSYFNSMMAEKEAFISARAVDFNNSLKGKSPEEVHGLVVGIVDSIKSSIKGAAVGLDIKTPAYRVSTSTFATSSKDETIKEIVVTFRNKLNAEVDYARKFTFSVSDSELVDAIYNSFITILNELSYIEQGMLVIEEVNAVLAKIKEEHPEVTVDLSFSFSDDDSIVLAISDTSIVFSASIEGILKTADMALFSKADDSFAELCQRREVDMYVASMSAVQFAPQVIKANVKVILNMLGSKITRRADKVLRRTYHKKAQFLATQKAGIGYYSEKVADSDAVIFALIEKDEEGCKVILSPFDARTLERVECDVLKESGLN